MSLSKHNNSQSTVRPMVFFCKAIFLSILILFVHFSALTLLTGLQYSVFPSTCPSLPIRIMLDSEYTKIFPVNGGVGVIVKWEFVARYYSTFKIILTVNHTLISLSLSDVTFSFSFSCSYFRAQDVASSRKRCSRVSSSKPAGCRQENHKSCFA